MRNEADWISVSPLPHPPHYPNAMTSRRPSMHPLDKTMRPSFAFHRTPCDHSLTTARDHHCEALRPELEVGGSGGGAALPPSPLGRLDAKERRRTPSGAINAVCLCSATWNFVVPPFLGNSSLL
uniref:Uncharacterized protein n=1 Tax=Oryza glumipatula TaxID=40148 RepID=A0A0D9Y930_9ORYZ